MPAAPADSALYAALLGDAETARLFTDSAEIRAMMLVEGALARVQGDLGLIPLDAAHYIQRAAHELLIDPAAMATEVARDGVPVPALINAFRKGMTAPDHAQYLHWGATSQDIMETAQILRLRQVLTLWEARLIPLLHSLADLAETHAALPMAARTYGQNATPSSFGALVASWGAPLLRHLVRLQELRPRLLTVSLGGAAGTLGAMGPQGPAVRAGLARALGLADPGSSWHAERDRITEVGAWMAGLCGSLGKIGEDLILLAHSGIAEVGTASAGASSTMPQKQNPVAASVLVALARQTAGLAATLQGAALHRESRDGAAWFTEWLSLPQLCISTGRATALTVELVQGLRPDKTAMATALDADGGLIHAEALCFALAQTLPRPEAQAAVKDLCAATRRGEGGLLALARARFGDHPGLAELDHGNLGEAPTQARAFARNARAIVLPTTDTKPAA